MAEEIDKPENRGYADNGIAGVQGSGRRASCSASSASRSTRRPRSTTASARSRRWRCCRPCFINPGDVTLMTVPGYPVAGTHTSTTAARSTTCRCSRENDFFPDLDGIPADVRGGRSCSSSTTRTARPARVATRDFYEQVDRLRARATRSSSCRTRPTSCSATRASRCQLPRRSPGAKDVGVEIHSMSKGFDMIGWRHRLVLRPPDDRAGVRRREGQQRLGPVHRDPEGRDRGARRPDDPGAHARRSTSAGCEKLVAMLRRCGFTCEMPGGTYFLYTPGAEGHGRRPHVRERRSGEPVPDQRAIDRHRAVGRRRAVPPLLGHLRSGRRARRRRPHGGGRGAAASDPPGLLIRADAGARDLPRPGAGPLAGLARPRRVGRRRGPCRPRRATAHVDRFTPAGHGEAGPPGERALLRPDGGARRSARRPRRSTSPARSPASGRWVDPRTWVYDFARDLPGRHHLHVHAAPRPGHRSGGAPVTVRPVHVLHRRPGDRARDPDRRRTRSPRIRCFVLQLDGDRRRRLDRRSTPASPCRACRSASAARCSRAPSATRSCARSTTGSARSRSSSSRRAGGSRTARPVALVWGPGIRSPSGVASDDAADVALDDRGPSFTAELTCERENADSRLHSARARCGLQFSAPVARGRPRAARSLVGPDDRRWTPDAARRTRTGSTELTFAPPFPPDADRSALELPPDLRDDAGRALENARQLPARRAHRRRAAARQVRRPVRHHRVEGRPDAAGHGAQPGARRGGPAAPGRAAASRRIPAADALDWLRRVAVSPRTRSVFAGTKPPAPARPIKLPRAAGRPGRGGDRHPARRAGALRRRAGEHAARRRAARNAGSDVRADRGAGHQPLGASQVGS